MEFRKLARAGLHPRFHGVKDIPSFEEVARQVHIERLPTWKNAKHAAQFISTLETYAFPKISRLSVDTVEQPEVLSVLSPIWTEKHETARRVARRIKTVLDMARSYGFRAGENPVMAIRDGGVLPKVKSKPKHHKVMDWRAVPGFYADLRGRNAMAAKALMFTCLTGFRTNEVLGMQWDEIDWEDGVWTCPEVRMKIGEEHRVPLTDEMLSILEPLKALKSKYVFEGQKRQKPLSNMAMLMLLRRMKIEGITVHGFRSAIRDWASEMANAPREIAEMSLAHKIGSRVERSYARSDLLDRRRRLMQRWSDYVTGNSVQIVEFA